MLDAASKALTDMLRPPLRSVLIKSILLALALIVVIGIVLQRALASLADSGATWAEQTSGFAPHAAWAALAPSGRKNAEAASVDRASAVRARLRYVTMVTHSTIFNSAQLAIFTK